MGGRVKVQRLRTSNYELITNPIEHIEGEVKIWEVTFYVRDRLRLCETSVQKNARAEYTRLKKIWRKNKEKFDKECAKMDFENLFSKAGMKI